MNFRLSPALAVAVSLLGSTSALAQTELMLWHMEQPPHRVERVQKLLDEFNAAHPEIVVKQEPQSWGEIYAKAPAALAAGNGPDMLFAIPDFAPILKKVGAVQDVGAFVKTLDEKHDLLDSAVASYSYDNGVWAVPLYNMAMSLWYRKSAFEGAGVAVPTNWTEWEAATKALTKDNTYGIGLPASKGLYTDQAVYNFMVNNSASEIYNADGSFAFDNPKTVESYAFASKMQKFSPPDSAGWFWGDAEACFASGTCASILQFTTITTFDQQGGGDPKELGVAPIPHADGESKHNTIAYANAVMLLSDKPEKRAAFETFIAWLVQPENYGRFLNMEPGLFLPVTADGAKAESFWNDPLVQKYRSQVETMIANSANGMLFGFTNGRTFPSIAPISGQNVLSETFQAVVIDGKDPAAAVAAGQARMQEISK
jgi:multiple sugar transport system substrate-binding protein